MKRIIKSMLSLALVLALTVSLSAGAFAAGTGNISVELNGKAIAFSDVQPILSGGRTFVPFRAVFEAMGAEVSFNDESHTVTAVRGDTTVRFTVGQSSVEVTTAGKTETVKTDAASIIKGSRTLVPVRFAAQALGCNVGWDADDKTVVIVDVDALIRENGGEFTLMDKYLAYARAFSEKNMAIKGTFDLSMKVTSEGITVPVAANGTIGGLVSETAMNMEMNVAYDLAALTGLMTDEEKSDAAMQAILEQLKNVKFEYIMNLTEGKIYLRCAALSTITHVSGDAWYCLDLAKLLKQAGMDMTVSDLMAMSTGEGNFQAYLGKLMRIIPLSDKEDAALIAESVKAVCAMLSDKAFTKSGDTYTSTVSVNEDETKVTTKMSFTVKNDQVTGYSMEMTMTLPESGSMTMTTSMDQDYKTVVHMDMSMKDVMEMVYDITMQYTETTKVPAAAPDSDSVIISVP